jgi:hypothetical protein
LQDCAYQEVFDGSVRGQANRLDNVAGAKYQRGSLPWFVSICYACITFVRLKLILTNESYRIDTREFILVDEDEETRLGFSLKESLALASTKRVLSGLNIWVSPLCKHAEDLHLVIEAAGGNDLVLLPESDYDHPIAIVLDDADVELLPVRQPLITSV